MSTTPTTPDPATMPLGDLKAAAGLDGGAPTVTQPPAAPAPAAPPAPDWGQINKGDDGTYQVTLATGEVFKGTADEVIAKQAESHVHTKRWGQDWKQKAESAQPAQPVPAAPAAPPEDPAEVATREWILEQQAKAMGMSLDEYKARVSMVFQTTEQMATNIAIADFHKLCPGYVDTPENSQVLGSYFPDDFGRFPTAQELKQAYALAVIDGKITPQAPAAPAAPRPPVMPTAGATPATSGDQSAWTMDMNALKKAAGLG